MWQFIVNNSYDSVVTCEFICYLSWRLSHSHYVTFHLKSEFKQKWCVMCTKHWTSIKILKFVIICNPLHLILQSDSHDLFNYWMFQTLSTASKWFYSCSFSIKVFSFIKSENIENLAIRIRKVFYRLYRRPRNMTKKIEKNNIIGNIQKECIFNISINNNKQNKKKKNRLVISNLFSSLSLVCICFSRFFHLLFMHFSHEFNLKNKVQVNIKMSSQCNLWLT